MEVPSTQDPSVCSWESQASNPRAFSSWGPGPVKIQLGLWAALAQEVTFCDLTHLTLAAQTLLVLLLWLRLTFCPHSSEDALLGHLFFLCSLLWCQGSCGFEPHKSTQILRKHSFMTPAKTISLSQTCRACDLPADFLGYLKSISVSIWVKRNWRSPTSGPLLVLPASEWHQSTPATQLEPQEASHQCSPFLSFLHWHCHPAFLSPCACFGSSLSCPHHSQNKLVKMQT